MTLQKLANKEIRFIPPQIYEFHRMKKFENFEKFSAYSLHRQKYGVRQWLPKYSSDLKVIVLPGNSFTGGKLLDTFYLIFLLKETIFLI